MKQDDREALKKLREMRKDQIEKVSTRVKGQNKNIKAIKKALQEGCRTVPQLAERTGLPTSEVFWYLAALKKYGQIREGEKEGNTFQYLLTNEPVAEEVEAFQGGNP